MSHQLQEKTAQAYSGACGDLYCLSYATGILGVYYISILYDLLKSLDGRRSQYLTHNSYHVM